VLSSFADPGCFFTGSGSENFFIPDPTGKPFVQKGGTVAKLNILFYCCLWFQEYRYPSFINTRIPKIMQENFTKKGARSGIRKNFIPDPGGKKEPDPGSGSATLVLSWISYFTTYPAGF
jgi:hypothetical protein